MSSRSAIASKLPRELYVEVTNRCNSHCETCIRTYERPEPLRDMTFDEFRAIADQFSALERVVLHGIGEPLLNVDLIPMIWYLKKRHPSAAVLFNSNAVLLDQEWQEALIEVGLDEYRVSLDAANAETYAQIRGIDAFDTVVENTRRFAQATRGLERPRLSFWLTATRENLGELPAMIDLAADIGVREVYVQRLVLTRHGLAQTDHSVYGRLRAREDAALAQAGARAATRGIEFRASGLTTPRESLGGRDNGRAPPEPPGVKPCSACFRLWTTTYITANGNVLPCCISPFSTHDYEALVLGNVFETPFAQIWNSERYRSRRAALYTTEPLHPCELCGANWAL